MFDSLTFRRNLGLQLNKEKIITSKANPYFTGTHINICKCSDCLIKSIND